MIFWPDMNQPRENPEEFRKRCAQDVEIYRDYQDAIASMRFHALYLASPLETVERMKANFTDSRRHTQPFRTVHDLIRRHLDQPGENYQADWYQFSGRIQADFCQVNPAVPGGLVLDHKASPNSC